MLHQRQTPHKPRSIYVYIILFATLTIIVKCSHLKALGEILFSESFPACKFMDLNLGRIICEIRSGEDENNIACLGVSSCKMPVTLCPDGSINKTCYPLKDDHDLSYQCICHSKKRSESIVPVTEWTAWMTSTSPYQSFISERSLIVPSLDWTVFKEFSVYRPEVYIISNDQLSPLSVYSASSYHNDAFKAYKASIDYIDYSGVCSWGAENMHVSWLQMSLPAEYEVIGAYIKQRCDFPQYVTRVKISRSANGVSWQTVIESEDLTYDSYDQQGSCSVLFPQTYTDRFWRIHVLAYERHPSMKADLIGYN